MIRHLGIDPAELDDEAWAELVNGWFYVHGKLQEVQTKNMRAVMEDVLYTIANKIYGN